MSDGHSWVKHEREGWTVCTLCGLVRNYERSASQCRGAVKIELREATGGEQGETAEMLEIVRLRRELGEALALRDRLATIVDEAFGPQEVFDTDALFSRLEHLLTERARQHEEVRRELYDVRRELNEAKAECDDARTKLAAVREELLVAEGNHCVDRDDHAAEVAKLSAALRNLIDSADASMTRDTIVLCDIDAARAVLGGRS